MIDILACLFLRGDGLIHKYSQQHVLVAVCRKAIAQGGKNYAVEGHKKSLAKENKGVESWWYSNIFFFVYWGKSSVSSFSMFLVLCCI